MKDSPIRIGAVNYLNTKPLIEDLELLAPETELVLDVPSRLADLLADGRLDVALIPVIEYFRAGTYAVVPNIAIASQGPVLSVTLFSRVPWPQIRRIALDEGSRTSAALVQILLQRRYGIEPEIVPLPLPKAAGLTPLPLQAGDRRSHSPTLPLSHSPTLSPSHALTLGVEHGDDIDADAVLLIGDRAMRACLPGFAHAFDLGQEWHDWTGLPFVYAFWAVREGVDLGPVADAMLEAKRRGLARIGPIAAREAPLLGLDAGFCRRYLAHIIRFDFGPREQAGLSRYYELACEMGLARRGVEVELYQAPRPVSV